MIQKIRAPVIGAVLCQSQTHSVFILSITNTHTSEPHLIALYFTRSTTLLHPAEEHCSIDWNTNKAGTNRNTAALIGTLAGALGTAALIGTLAGALGTRAWSIDWDTNKVGTNRNTGALIGTLAGALGTAALIGTLAGTSRGTGAL